MDWQFGTITNGVLANKFVIVIPCFNAEATIAQAIISVVNQDFSDLGVIIRNDQSTDNTSKVIRNLFGTDNKEDCFYIKSKGRDIIFIENNEKFYGGGNTYDSVIRFVNNPYTIIGVVDGDDYLLVKNALSIMFREYQRNKDKWLIWSQHISRAESDFFLNGLSHPLPDDQTIYSTREYWGVSHFRTCLKGLFSLVDPYDLYEPNHPGQYARIGGDAAFLYPIIEMCGNSHSLFIDSLLYYYNDTLPTNDSTLYASELEFYRRFFQNKSRYKPLGANFKFY